MKRRLLKILGFAAFAAALSANIARAAGAPPPKLVLQITVDQLRRDLPGRNLERMGDGGFRYLMEHGVWYANAHHAHANTETVVGHTTLATGADPAAHGMVANVWLDRKTGSDRKQTLAATAKLKRYRQEATKLVDDLLQGWRELAKR